MKKDKLYEEVKNFVQEQEEVSCQDIQDKFKIGYNLCGKIIDGLEGEKIIAGFRGGKNRTVLIKKVKEVEPEPAKTWDEFRKYLKAYLIVDLQDFQIEAMSKYFYPPTKKNN